ncbi:NACHT, LRR and PYD domains-containing protein 1b allele 3-like isoform X2 [Neoarius graeffei]|uniref:NACHT, LRR and PYD domains-containing protein 1b allele 3-like isoform X2 n=1 Tax=Neoarius graeffei TaxID=443677 RepID=UPI00298C133B|nr:NACHT, LRR and PYD domains-containing protein 1b allele 3-like isoform X2 [Neoarius graeffei]
MAASGTRHLNGIQTVSEKLEGACSTFPQHPETVHHSDTEVLCPELIVDDPVDEKRDMYRFQCSHAGRFQCKYTSLVFEMSEKGEVLYSVVFWGSSYLDGVGQMQPAGPLYNINCFPHSVCKLHLPHCETDPDKNQPGLVVAHFTDGNVEIIQPLEVTDTHVIIDIKNLSLFGLLKKKLLKEKPIKAQVLLFYREITGKTKRSKLHMHLLPRTVPVTEVKKQFRQNTYIESTSECHLTPDKRYRPRCEPHRHQPTTEIFDCDYGPNYHPTFEVLFNGEVEELTLGLLDEHDQEVWQSRQVFLPGESANVPKKAKSDAEFVDKHREKLIEKASLVMPIADCLRSKKMITGEMHSLVGAATTPQEQMRTLYRFVDSEGRAVKEEFYKILKEKHPYVVDDLESGSSKA